ncbi:cysteine desulfurase family protein [Terrihabitans soli]
MMADRIYLDHNATSPVRPEAARAVARALISGGNPSSVHSEGRKARGILEKSREAVAALVGAEAKNVTFTSGATEALNLALTPGLRAGKDARPWHLFVSSVEHPAVLNGHGFAAEKVTILPVSAAGILDLKVLGQALDSHTESRPLLALQLANSETGVIQPVKDAADLVHARGGLLVCDAVQAAGRIPVDIKALGADLIVLSAHKLGGPAGSGALIRASDTIQTEARIRGGGQEKSARAGTENLAGAAGFAAAAEAALQSLEEEAARLTSLRERFEAGLKTLDPNVTVFGAAAARLPNTISFAFQGTSAETSLIALDLAGFAVSSGSACSSGKVKPSHVLEAMGVSPDISKGMLRASFGWTTCDSDIDQFLGALPRLRANSPAVGKVLAA